MTVGLGLDRSTNRLPLTLPALRRYLDNLDLVRREFEKDRLAGFMGAIAATERLLMDLDPGDTAGRRAPFTSLNSALGDLCNGRELPLYFRPHKNGRSIDSAETWIMRANAAVIMDCLVAGGMNKAEAAKAVSRRVADAGIKCGKSTVAEWRRQLMEGNITDNNGSPPPFAIRGFRQMTADPKPLGRPPRTEAGRQALLNFFSHELAHRGFVSRK